MKLKVTKKQIRDNFHRVISIGYCDAYALLRDFTPFGFGSGVYGWNFNAYDFGGVCIVTGYRPFGDVSPDYKTLQRYEKRAQHLKTKAARAKLVNKFINDVLRNETPQIYV